MVHWDVPRTPTGALLAVRFGEDLGVAPEVSLRGTGLRLERLADPREEVTASAELAVVRNVLAAVGDRPGRGLDAGSRFTLSSYGIWGFALVTSPTLRSAIDVAFQFLDLTFAFATIGLRSSGPGLQLVLTAPDVEPGLRRFAVERDAAATAVVVRDLVGPAAPHLDVRFALPEPPADVVRRWTDLLGARPVFDAPETVVSVDAGLLDTRLPQANEVTMAMALDQCRDLLERRRARSGISGQVRDLLLANLADPPDARRVAALLAMSDRTLRHRLAAEGTTFRALLDEVRERLAEELLLRGGLPVAEVAVRLGYVEVSSFSQAFRRWKGVGPREYRSRNGGAALARAGVPLPEPRPATGGNGAGRGPGVSGRSPPRLCGEAVPDANDGRRRSWACCRQRRHAHLRRTAVLPDSGHGCGGGAPGGTGRRHRPARRRPRPALLAGQRAHLPRLDPDRAGAARGVRRAGGRRRAVADGGGARGGLRAGGLGRRLCRARLDPLARGRAGDRRRTRCAGRAVPDAGGGLRRGGRGRGHRGRPRARRRLRRPHGTRVAGMVTSRGRRRTRESVFAALRELLLEKPWAEVTLEAVAKRAGVSRQTLYNDFGSRQGLAQAYTFAMAEAYCDAVDEVLAGEPDPQTALAAALQLFLDGTAEDPLIRRVQSGEAHHDLVRIVTSESGPLLDRIAERLAASLARRWPDAGQEVVDAAATLMARLALGLVTMPPPSGERLATRVARLIGPALGV